MEASNVFSMTNGSGEDSTKAGGPLGTGNSTNCIQTYPPLSLGYGSTYPAYPSWDEVSIRFVSNGCILKFRGQEFIFKDVIQAAEHAEKMRKQK